MCVKLIIISWLWKTNPENMVIMRNTEYSYIGIVLQVIALTQLRYPYHRAVKCMYVCICVRARVYTSFKYNCIITITRPCFDSRFFYIFLLLLSIFGIIVVIEVVFVILVALLLLEADCALNFLILWAALTALNHLCHRLRASNFFIQLVSRVYIVSIFVGSEVSQACSKQASADILFFGSCWSRSRIKCLASFEIYFSWQMSI